MCSDKRMHRVLETLKPPVLSAAVKASLLQVFPPSPAELCQSPEHPGAGISWQTRSVSALMLFVLPTAICNVPLAAHGGEGRAAHQPGWISE